MYQIELTDDTLVDIPEEQFYYLFSQYFNSNPSPEIKLKVDKIKSFHINRQGQLSGFEYAKSVAERLRAKHL